jgi:hypothetical protein
MERREGGCRMKSTTFCHCGSPVEWEYKECPTCENERFDGHTPNEDLGRNDVHSPPPPSYPPAENCQALPFRDGFICPASACFRESD